MSSPFHTVPSLSPLAAGMVDYSDAVVCFSAHLQQHIGFSCVQGFVIRIDFKIEQVIKVFKIDQVIKGVILAGSAVIIIAMSRVGESMNVSLFQHKATTDTLRLRSYI